MLDLKLPTDPRWVNVAEMNIEEILTDHAYCEQKAASSCISLIVSYPEREQLVRMLTPIVAEEWSHFRMVVDELTSRGYKLGRQRKDEYVNQLMGLIRPNISKEEKLMDKLLINAMIEARSCERFRILWKNLSEERLKRFYNKLMISEAGHYQCFIDLAKVYFDAVKVGERWDEITTEEAKILSSLSVDRARVH